LGGGISPDLFFARVSMRGELKSLRETLRKLRAENKLLIAILYGSFSEGTPHVRSDVDLALYLNTGDDQDEMEAIDSVLMSVDRQVSILRLDDEDESPFVVQEALKGTHLVEPDRESLYAVSHRVLHECENMRFRRGLSIG
jgi:predicted nucleotidyltransferase